MPYRIKQTSYMESAITCHLSSDICKFELIKIKDNGINFETIKEFLNNDKEVNVLKLNNSLKIRNIYENIDINKINEIIMHKKKISR